MKRASVVLVVVTAAAAALTLVTFSFRTPRAEAPPVASTPLSRKADALLRDAGLERHSAFVAPQALPSLRLVPRGAGTARTRLGGEPELPDAVQWPTWKGQPLAFIAQVDLAEVAPLAPGGLLPRAGLLSFFYDAEQRTWGFDPADRGSWRVLYSPPGGPAPRLRPTPPQVPEAARYKPVGLEAREELTLLPWEEFPEDRELSAAERETYGVLTDTLAADGAVRHRLLGHPDLIQNPMQLECQLASNGIFVGDAKGYADPRVAALTPGAAEWRLLLQVDSEDAAGMMWGDVGRLYFWIRESDLKRAYFDDVWMVLQCS